MEAITYIANIAFARSTLDEDSKYKKFGRLWYDPEKHSCAIALKGFRQGQFFGKPYKTVVEPPFIKGDIVAVTGEFTEGDVPKKEYMWCGWIWTDSDQRGCVYNGVLEINPMPSMMYVIMRQAQKQPDAVLKTALFLPVFLEDRDSKGPTTEEYLRA